MKKIVTRLFSTLLVIISFTLIGCNAEQVDQSHDSNSNTEKTFTITWLNFDGAILEVDNNVEYGSMPSYDGDTPVRESTNDYKYIFNGWSPEISQVTSDITYVAQFKTTSAYTFKVTWLNYDGTVLEVDDAPLGSMPSYDGDTPVKPSDTFYDYTFNGWTPDFDTVLRDITYTAQYTSTYKYDYLNFYFDIKEDENLNKYIEVRKAISTTFEPVDFVIPPYVNFDGENIPVKSIGSYAFDGRETSIAIGGGIILNSISIPNTVTHICSQAFSFYSEDYGEYNTLTSIFIPNSVTSMERNAFFRCSDFSIYCEVTKKPDGWASNWSNKTPVVWGYAGIDGITEDGIRYAVSRNDKGDKNIAITGCKGNNKNLIIPSFININGEDIRVTSIGEYAFYGSSSTSIYIPDSVTSIGEYAFYGSSLTSIYIPDSVTTVGSYAFQGCSSLTIYCEASSKPSGRDSSWNYSYCPVVWHCENYGITVEGIYYVVLADEKNIKYISIIGYAYSDNKVLIPESINVNGEDISVKAIADNAFYDNDTITSITISKSVTSIGNSTFQDCSNLITVTISENSQLTTIGEGAFSSCISLTSIVIPDSVTTIDYRAFYNCSNLTTVIISKNGQLTTIGEDAFSSCIYLTSIYIPSSVATIRDSAFSSCSNLIIYCETSSKPSGWYYGWNSSYRPVVRSSNGEYGEYNGFIYGISIDSDDKPYITITSYTDLSTNVVVPSSINVDGKDIPVKAIADNAFYDNDTITSITIPNSVTSIGDSAFGSCSNLTTVAISKNSQLTTIGEGAFSGCIYLASIYIPNSVATIRDSAFSSCSNLIIYCEASYKQSGWDYDWNSNRPVVWDTTYDEYLAAIA